MGQRGWRRTLRDGGGTRGAQPLQGSEMASSVWLGGTVVQPLSPKPCSKAAARSCTDCSVQFGEGRCGCKGAGVPGEQLCPADAGTSPWPQAIIRQQLSPVGATQSEALPRFCFPDV